MNEFTKGVQDEEPWCMMFADDVVLVDKNKNVLVEGKFKRWQEILEKNGLKISNVNTKIFKFMFKNKVEKYVSDHNVRLGDLLIRVFQVFRINCLR